MKVLRELTALPNEVIDLSTIFITAGLNNPKLLIMRCYGYPDNHAVAHIEFQDGTQSDIQIQASNESTDIPFADIKTISIDSTSALSVRLGQSDVTALCEIYINDESPFIEKLGERGNQFPVLGKMWSFCINNRSDSYISGVGKIDGIVFKPNLSDYPKTYSRHLAPGEYTSMFLAGRGFSIRNRINGRLNSGYSEAVNRVFNTQNFSNSHPPYSVTYRSEIEVAPYATLPMTGNPPNNSALDTAISMAHEDLFNDFFQLTFSRTFNRPMIGMGLVWIDPSIGSHILTREHGDYYRVRPIMSEQYLKQKLADPLTAIQQSEIEWDNEDYIQDITKSPSMKITANSRMVITLDSQVAETDFWGFSTAIQTTATASYPYSIVFSAPSVCGISFLSPTKIKVHLKNRDAEFTVDHVGKWLNYCVTYGQTDIELRVNNTVVAKDSQVVSTRTEHIKYVGLDVRGTRLGNNAVAPSPTEHVLNLGYMMIHNRLDSSDARLMFEHARMFRDLEGQLPMRSNYIDSWLQIITQTLAQMLKLPNLSGVSIVDVMPSSAYRQDHRISVSEVVVPTIGGTPVTYELTRESNYTAGMSSNNLGNFSGMGVLQQNLVDNLKVFRKFSYFHGTSGGSSGVGEDLTPWISSFPFSNDTGMTPHRYKLITSRRHFEIKRVEDNTTPANRVIRDGVRVADVNDFFYTGANSTNANIPASDPFMGNLEDTGRKIARTASDANAWVEVRGSTSTDGGSNKSWVGIRAGVDYQSTDSTSVKVHPREVVYGFFSSIDANMWDLKIFDDTDINDNTKYILNMTRVKSVGSDGFKTLTLAQYMNLPNMGLRLVGTAPTIDDAIAGTNMGNSVHDFTPSRRDSGVLQVWHNASSSAMSNLQIATHPDDPSWLIMRVQVQNVVGIRVMLYNTILPGATDPSILGTNYTPPPGIYVMRKEGLRASWGDNPIIKVPDKAEYNKYFTGELYGIPEAIDMELGGWE